MKLKHDGEDRRQTRRLFSHILKMSNDIFLATKISVPSEWLASDMTIAQLRILLLIQTEGPVRMSEIAASIGTTMPTATGTANVLVKKGLLTRRDDPEDRRIVVCELSQQGKDMMNRMWTMGQQQIVKLLTGLSVEELQKADEVATILLRNVTSKKNTKGTI